MEELLSNDRIISFHRQKHDYEPSPENTLQFAYGDRRYVKMTLELYEADEILQLKTLEAINEDFHRGDLTGLALMTSDLLGVLVDHLSNPHNKIRELSASALVLMSQVKLGRDHIIRGTYVKQLMILFDDHVEIIRHHAYQCLLNISEFQEGIDHILSMGVLLPLVDKLIMENVESILGEVLQLINRTLHGEQGQVEVLRTPAIKRLTGLLERENWQLRQLACQNLAGISFSERGKIDVINNGCVPHLLAKLTDKEERVIESASIALASLAQRNEAKFQIMDMEKLPLILTLLNHPNEQIVLNIVQLVASMAEHPKGRELSKLSLDIMKSIIQKYEYIAPYAEQAIEVINWTP